MSNLIYSGFCLRTRLVRNFRDKTLFGSFNPAVSPSPMKAMREAVRELKLWHQTQLTLGDIARKLNPLLRGWIEYYGRYARSGLYPLFRYINLRLRAWVMRKFKRLKHRTVQASRFLTMPGRGTCESLRSLADPVGRHVYLMGAE